VIGTNASYCYNTKLKDEEHATRIAKHYSEILSELTEELLQEVN